MNKNSCLASADNAIFKSYDKRYIDGTTILSGDRQLVADG